MSLLSMCVYSTPENGKDECLRKALLSVMETVDLKRHRLFLCVNGATAETEKILDWALHLKHFNISIIRNETNLGTAEGINKAWRFRQPGEPVIKLDDDIIFHQIGWADRMEEAIQRDPQIGIIGLKRRDLIQTPWHPDPHYRSEMILLPHEPGQKWIVIEKTDDIIGSCTMFNPLLLDKTGYSFQPGRYGFEDNLFCHRSHLAGFYNCFLHSIDIEHIDPSAPEYSAWKQQHSGDKFPEFHAMVHAMIAGTKSIYYNPFES